MLLCPGCLAVSVQKKEYIDDQDQCSDDHRGNRSHANGELATGRFSLRLLLTGIPVVVLLKISKTNGVHYSGEWSTVPVS